MIGHLLIVFGVTLMDISLSSADCPSIVGDIEYGDGIMETINFTQHSEILYYLFKHFVLPFEFLQT